MLAHELDAIQCREYLMHPLTYWLPPRVGYHVFVAAHVPILMAIFHWHSRRRFRLGWNIFSIIHVVLHIGFLWHPLNQFRSAFSWILIGGSGLFGAIDLFLPRKALASSTPRSD
jgi:hypothetical protein